ncbi:MAG TPA: hypothetical protein VD838_15050, partial [Anaeromyxobacteraceae bacterium]|nr:hypothetical protein [Anaeromyxobacteraceae bacterium]
MHLDARTHRELLAGALPPEAARALARHLEDGCERCEAFLAARGEADAVDGRVDRALAGASSAPAAGNAAELAAIERRLSARPAPLRPVPVRAWSRR